MQSSNCKYVAEADNLSRNFAATRAVASVSLKVGAGEIFGIVGPDGAGKSTLLRMLATILHPDQGDARVCGFSAIIDAEAVKNRIAYMSQRFALYSDLTVHENIRFYADLYNVPEAGLEERIDELLHFSGMHPFKKRLAGRLSGGMKQKLQLICALIHTPELLILDEPTNGVDPVSRRDFWRMLQNLAGRGAAIIVSTSYLDEAERCHRLALMHEGGFFTTGRLDEIIARADFEVAVWRSDLAPRVFAELRRRVGDHGVRLFGNSIRIRNRTASGGIRELVDEIARLEGCAGAWEPDEKPGLEDVFVRYLETASAGEIAGSKNHFASNQGLREICPVQIKGLRRVFGDFTAVDSISLDVKQGEIFGFLGPNGAGKSTTIRMLCGLLLPTSGEGTVAGFDLRRDAERIKRCIGYMSQKFSLYTELTVAENLRFYGGIYGLGGDRLEARLLWALDMAGLHGFACRQVKVLSLGFRQRLALACSLLHEPSIVFLDEPTSGVDPLTRRQFWGTIRDLAHAGVTVFVTTHYMEEAEYCDRIAFINNGRIMACGSPEKLKKEIVRHRIYRSDKRVSAAELDGMKQLPGIVDAYVHGTGLHFAIERQESVPVLCELIGCDFSELQEVAASMEDVFVQLASVSGHAAREEYSG